MNDLQQKRLKHKEAKEAINKLEKLKRKLKENNKFGDIKNKKTIDLNRVGKIQLNACSNDFPYISRKNIMKSISNNLEEIINEALQKTINDYEDRKKIYLDELNKELNVVKEVKDE